MSSSDLTAAEWRPAAAISRLRERARILGRIRTFFAEREVWEVETPIASRAALTDPHIDSVPAELVNGTPWFLHTSPEFPMKRLLAAGSGAIYQLARVFRQGEQGRLHNPEFTLLEWYRPGFDHHRLMDEVEALLDAVAGAPLPAERLTFAEAFRRHTGVNPHYADVAALRGAAQRVGVTGLEAIEGDRELWIDLLLTHVVEPRLGGERPCFLYDYPASRAALARIRPGTPPVAERFELYWQGVELANGFHELADAVEQRRRFGQDLATRRAAGLPELPVDERLLAALDAGLPACAGVALGVDRLVMLAVGARSLAEVVAFPVDRA